MISHNKTLRKGGNDQNADQSALPQLGDELGSLAHRIVEYVDMNSSLLYLKDSILEIARTQPSAQLTKAKDALLSIIISGIKKEKNKQDTITVIYELFNSSNDWSELSANRKLMQKIIDKIEGFDKKVPLTIEQFRRLPELYLKAIPVHLAAKEMFMKRQAREAEMLRIKELRKLEEEKKKLEAVKSEAHLIQERPPVKKIVDNKELRAARTRVAIDLVERFKPKPKEVASGNKFDFTKNAELKETKQALERLFGQGGPAPRQKKANPPSQPPTDNAVLANPSTPETSEIQSSTQAPSTRIVPPPPPPPMPGRSKIQSPAPATKMENTKALDLLFAQRKAGLRKLIPEQTDGTKENVRPGN